MIHFYDVAIFSIIFLVSLTSNLEAKECGVSPDVCPQQSIYYYSIDGSCNNLIYKEWGSINTPYDRLISYARYGDGIKSITKARDGSPLPNARTVRVTVLPDDKFNLDYYLTRAVIGHCQFFAHDIGSQDLPADPLACCTTDMKKLSYPPAYCASIDLPYNDCVYSTVQANCMSVVNTKTNLDYQCSLTYQAQQMSTTTHYMDLSPIYGNTMAKHNKIRTFKYGRIKTEIRNGYEYLPINTENNYGCNIPQYSDEKCYVSGDPNVNQQPDLTTFNLLWVREHNRLADGLYKVNPCWTDEEIFQEARSINIATHQWQFYFELLPLLLGKKLVQEKGIAVQTLGYTEDYDYYCKANVFNEFAHFAFRVLHSLIRGTLVQFDEYRLVTGSVHLQEHMEGTQKFLEFCDNFDGNLRGICTQYAHKVGPDQEFAVANQLFRRLLAFGIDLSALDMQRGRLNGLPSYNDMRAFCGYKRAVYFEDFEDFIHPDDVALLKLLYKCVDDVDAYVGGRLEIPVEYSVVGPTTLCVLIKQFLRTRQCDRLWFEHKAANFNLFQLNAIRLTGTLAKLACNNGNNIKFMQAHAFEPLSPLNPLLPCFVLPDLDLNLWKDPKCIFTL